MPEFNEQDAVEKFDEENPEVEIPDEIIDDINNDWVLTEEENEALIAKYFADKSGDWSRDWVVEMLKIHYTSLW